MSSRGSNRGGHRGGLEGRGRGGRGGQFRTERQEGSSTNHTDTRERFKSDSGRGRGGFHGQRPSYSFTEQRSLVSGQGVLGSFDREEVRNVNIETRPITELSKPSQIDLPTSHVVASVKEASNGKKCNLLTNYFSMSLPEGPFYQYDVKINPKVEIATLANFLVHQNELFKDNVYIYDGRAMLFTQKLLKKNIKDKVEFTSQSKDGNKYAISISYASTVSSAHIDSSVLQLFNLIYRRALAHLDLKRIGRNYYNMNEKAVITVPEHNIKILPGAIATTYPSSNGILFNVDMIYKTLRTDSVLSIIVSLKKKFGTSYENRINGELSNKIIMCNYGPRKRTVHIDSVDFTKTPKDKFKTREGQSISFAQYMTNTYKMNVTDMNQPMLVHRDRKDPNKVEYYVPEFCSLTGLTDQMKQDHRIMKSLRFATGLTPTQRIKQIAFSVKENNDNKEFKETISDWNFGIDSKMLSLNGRLLPPEKIKLTLSKEKEKFIQLTQESASWDIRKDRLLRPVSMTNWLVFYPVGCDKDAKNFLKVLYDVSKPLGISFSDPTIIEVANTSQNGYKTAIEENIQETTSFCLVILPNDNPVTYNTIKKVACNDIGVLSQCVKYDTISNPKGIQSKATKIAVQIVSKQRGAPWTVGLTFPHATMVIGMDVYHSGEIYLRSKASVVGFVASLDISMTEYYSRCIVQQTGKEIVQNLAPCFLDALERFKNKNKIYPKSVIFYRDGVGEGQIEDVLEEEVKACQKVILDLGADIKLNYMIVLKRINTRLFASNKEGEIINPLPGTIVDSGITSIPQAPKEGLLDPTARALEFFLVSHSVREQQGTATPTKYQCILNQSELSAEFYQNLTFKLCHMYFNWFGTIRVPAPCLYAHKIAFLVGQSTLKEKFHEKLYDYLFYL